MSMHNLMMAGNTLMQMQTMQSASMKLQGRANVLKSELKTDPNPSEGKKAQIEELENRAMDLTAQLMENAQKTNEELKKTEVDKTKEEEKKTSNGTKKDEEKEKAVTDRVEVSGANPEAGNSVVRLEVSDSVYSYTNTGLPQTAPFSSLKVDITA